MSTWTKGLAFFSLGACVALTTACGVDSSKKKNRDDPTANDLTTDGALASRTGAFLVKAPETEGALVASRFLTLRLRFAAADGTAAQSITDVTLKPWMTTMGHGTATKKLTLSPVEGQPDVIEVGHLWFTMGGPWDLMISATVNGIADEIVVPVEVEQ